MHPWTKTLYSASKNQDTKDRNKEHPCLNKYAPLDKYLTNFLQISDKYLTHIWQISYNKYKYKYLTNKHKRKRKRKYKYKHKYKQKHKHK